LYDRDKTAGIGCISIVFVLMVGFIIHWFAYKGSQEWVEISITHKERTGGEHSRYLVFTDGEVFENTDSLAFWKFDSSDIYGHMAVGKTYRARVAGWRVRFMSMYRNIIEVQEIEPAR
jgi:hypothetical protein